MATLIADPRLAWVDAMWIDDDGNLLIPASQLDRALTLTAARTRAVCIAYAFRTAG